MEYTTGQSCMMEYLLHATSGHRDGEIQRESMIDEGVEVAGFSA